MTTQQANESAVTFSDLRNGCFNEYLIFTSDNEIHAVFAKSKSRARRYLNEKLDRWDFRRMETRFKYRW